MSHKAWCHSDARPFFFGLLPIEEADPFAELGLVAETAKVTLALLALSVRALLMHQSN